MAERTVNARQREVLQWIADGCIEGRWPEGDVSYKATAVALKGRRLVTISKKKGLWSAAVTDAGKHFIEHGEYPAGHWTASEPPRTIQQVRTRVKPKRVTGLRPVDQLIRDLVDAGGTLVVEDSENYYGNLASAATRYGKVPTDKLVEVTRGPVYGQRTVRLVDKPHWMTTVLQPIPVRDRLTKPHPAITVLKENKEQRLTFKGPTRQRALLLLDALAKEAARRRYTVEAAPVRRHHGYQYDPITKWDLRISIGEDDYDITVTEDADKTPHQPTAKELADAARPFAPRIPKYDHTPSGRLRFTVSRGWAVRQDNFADTKTLNLDNRLPEVLQEIELRAAAAEERRIAAEHEQAERQSQWETVRAQAVLEYAENYKADILKTRVERWREHTQLGEYVAALASRVGELTGDAQTEADEWLMWARAHLASNNPFDNRSIGVPDVPEPKAEQLRPFMQGLDPYGARGY